MTSCAADADLQSFMLGKLPDEEEALVEEHLHNCRRCADTLAQLRLSDTLFDAVRRATAVKDFASAESVLADLTADLMRLRPRVCQDRAAQARAVAERLAAPQGADEIGRLGPYRIIKALGSGGMGIVYLGEDSLLKRLVALKVMSPALTDDSAYRERFVREAQAAAAVKHDHVVTIYQVGEERGLPYLAMELLYGETLADRLQREQRLPSAEAARIGREIADGLAALHEHGLVHRDIKPSNIFLEARSEHAPASATARRHGGRVKILDFGLARTLDDVADAGAAAGTPQYIAPEQAAGGPVDHRADLYGLGGVLYAMVTGRPPQAADDTQITLRRASHAVPTPVRDINTEVPHTLASVIGKLLAKRPEDRIQSAQEASRLLDHRAVGAKVRKIVRGLIAACLLVGLTLSVTEFTGVTQLRSLFFGQPDRSADAKTKIIPAAPPGLLDQLDPKQIPSNERFSWQPKELVAVLGEHRGRQWSWATTVAISPDGKLAVSAGNGGFIYLWDADTLRLRALLLGHVGEVWSVAISRDNSRLLSGGTDGMVRLWDLKEHRELRRFEGHADTVWSVAFSPDGRRALSGGDDRLLRLWDVEAGKELSRFEGHTARITSVTFSPDGSHGLTGSDDKTMRLWDVATGKEVRVLTGHAEGFRIVAFLPDGQRAVSCSHDKSVRLWDLQTGDELRRFDGHAIRAHCVAVSPDGRRILSCGRDKTIRHWDVESGRELLCIQVRSSVASGTITPDGRRALTGEASGAVRLWNLEDGNEVHASGAFPENRLCRVAISRDGRHVLSCMGDEAARLWDVTTAKQVHRFDMLQDASGVAFSADDREALCAGARGLVVWDVQTGQELRRFEGATRTVSVAGSRDGRRALTGGIGGALRLWDAETGTEVSSLVGHAGHVVSVALAPDGRHALSCGLDGTTRIWDLESGRQVERVKNWGAAWSVAFAPDGRHAASAADHEIVRLWDMTVSPPQQRSLPRLHTGHVPAVAFSADGQTLASAGLDGQIVLYDVATGNRIREVHMPGPILGLAFAADGRHLVTANGNGTVYILRLSPIGARK